MGSFQSFKGTGITNNFYPGPLSCIAGSGSGIKRDFGAATTDATTAAQYDKVFCVERWEIDIFLRWYKCSQDPTCDASVSFPGYSIPNYFIK